MNTILLSFTPLYAFIASFIVSMLSKEELQDGKKYFIYLRNISLAATIIIGTIHYSIYVASIAILFAALLIYLLDENIHTHLIIPIISLVTVLNPNKLLAFSLLAITAFLHASIYCAKHMKEDKQITIDFIIQTLKQNPTYFILIPFFFLL